MGEAPPRPLPPGAPILLFFLSLARSGAACDGEKFNLQQDLPPEEQYRCLGAPWLIPKQVSPSIAETYQVEESKIICMDTKIVYNQSIPNSGPHRLFRAVYGEYEYCPPQRWLHNLKHGGIAFLYHPCVHPLLRDQLVLLARSCLPDHILTPYTGLSQTWPLALVAWGATLQMARVELDRAVAWLQRHAAQGRPDQPQKGESYHHLLKHPTVLPPVRDVCPEQQVQALQKLFQRCNSHKIPSKLQAAGRQRRAPRGLMQVPHAHAATPSSNLVAARIGTPPFIADGMQAQGKDVPQLAGGPHRNTTALAGQGSRSLPPALPTKECWCIDKELGTAQQQQRKEAKGQQVGVRVPTPRTEEAAWAASALTFLLVVLTVAVLYTRLHRNCRRGLSLYWTTSGDDGHETVAAVIKRRLLSTQSRRKKRSRQQLKVLLPTTSSDSSE